MQSCSLPSFTPQRASGRCAFFHVWLYLGLLSAAGGGCCQCARPTKLAISYPDFQLQASPCPKLWGDKTCKSWMCCSWCSRRGRRRTQEEAPKVEQWLTKFPPLPSTAATFTIKRQPRGPNSPKMVEGIMLVHLKPSRSTRRRPSGSLISVSNALVSYRGFALKLPSGVPYVYPSLRVQSINKQSIYDVCTRGRDYGLGHILHIGVVALLGFGAS